MKISSPCQNRGYQLLCAAAFCGFAFVFPRFLSSAGDQKSPKPASPVDPVLGIIDAFKTYRVVALGEGDHGNEQGHALRLALIRDPRFAAAANDIVVEFGNSLYQEVMDRFVRGEDVTYRTLRQVWQNTTQTHSVWDRPIYEEFFRAVREVNLKLPKDRALRVLLGDPPIDWDQVSTQDDLNKIGRMDTVPTGIIEREVIAKGRRALIIYGDMHYRRKNMYWKMQDGKLAEEWFAKPVATIVANLEQAGTKVFSIHTTFADLSRLQPDVAAWEAPKLALLAGTPLGMAPFTFYHPYQPMILKPDKTWEKVSADPKRSPSMQDQFDAILYIGPKSSITYSKLPLTLCDDPDYMRMRLGRMKLSAGSNRDWAGDELRGYCAGFRTVK